LEKKIKILERYPRWYVAIAIITLCSIAFIYYGSIRHMSTFWFTQEEYSHGIMIPVISIFLIWQKKEILRHIQYDKGLGGLVLIVIGLIVNLLGELSAISIISQYSLVITITGLVYSFIGREAIKKIWIVFVFLLFMIPLPAVIYQGLSSELQLISSDIGVRIIRLFGISVYLEGNVIDLGNYKLQVVEACSGLRYLFPLMSLAFITAYFYQANIWKRGFVFFSSIPITVLLNSTRIGIIGILVEYYGSGMAEGFLHDFEGWVVFMACMLIIILEMWIIEKIGDKSKKLNDVFFIGIEKEKLEQNAERKIAISKSFLVGAVLIIIAAPFMHSFQDRVDIIPDRIGLDNFPLELNGWKGNRTFMEQIYVDRLHFDDYILANYSDGSGASINLYMVYYGSQRKGASIHSPRACLPGGGWKVDSFSEIDMAINGYNNTIPVNRAVVKMGDYTQLVYYWFQQRGRFLSNEYVVKWYLFVDSIIKRRTDGALIRLSTAVLPDERMENAENRLRDLANQVVTMTPKYIPE